jgi:HD-like signal output (HDOD) protein
MLTIDALIGSIKDLPPAPRNLVRLLDLLNQTDVDIDQVVGLIEFDAALTAQVIRQCNSAYLGSATPASDLREATARLGLNQIFQIVVALSSAAAMRPAQKGYGIEPGELWKHSVTAALAGKLLALEKDDNASLVFTACLLHDVGKIALSHKLEGRYHEVLAETQRSQRPMLHIERDLLGFDHAAVGGRLLETWCFPASLSEPVRFHHDPASAPEHRKLAAYTYLGNMIACLIGAGCGHEALALTSRAEALELIDIDIQDIPRFMTKTFAARDEIQSFLQLA